MTKVCLNSLLVYPPFPLAVKQRCVGDELNPTHPSACQTKTIQPPTCGRGAKKTMENKRVLGDLWRTTSRPPGILNEAATWREVEE